MNVRCVPARGSLGSLACRAALLGLILLLCACNRGASINIANSQTSDPATVEYPIFYVKRTIPPTSDDLRLMRVFFPSADLYMRASASPSATETNITARITAGLTYDVKDVDTSLDGTTVAFAMRGPLTPGQLPQDAPSWRIYEYTIATDTLTPMIDPANDIDPDTVNDVSPHYLPDFRIVFSSTRQRQSQAVLLDEGLPQFIEQDEAFTEPTFNLHVISVDRTQITQISFNQSHERDATVLMSGRVLWSRWDHTPGHDAMHLYSANPDGTDLELYYGANSHLTGTSNSVIEFVRPRELQNGSILAIIRPYTDGQTAADGSTAKIDFGGNLVMIDGVHYVENTQALAAYQGQGFAGPAETPATQNDVITIPGPSPGGRFSSAYPLWDGTGRILVTWTQCRLLNTAGALTPCTATALGQIPVVTGPPLYSVWIYDPSQNTFLPVMQPVEGVMVTDVAVAQPRNPLPNIILPPVNGSDEYEQLLEAGTGVVDIRSVYDVDGVDTTPAGIMAIADGKTPASQRPARFLRLVKAVSIPDPSLVNLSQAAFGVSNYMREIMGYVPIQPDGSVRVRVPANVAFEVTVLDANARLLSNQGTWLQIATGETVNCNGCHTPAANQNVPACTPQTVLCTTPVSHGRSGSFLSIYPGAAGGAPFPDSVSTLATGQSVIPTAGQTMAETLALATCVEGSVCSETPTLDVLYTDIWTNTSVAPANPAITYSYTALTPPEAIPTTALCESSWAASCRTRINYPEHIQPIWDYSPRTKGTVSLTCSQAGCHNPQNSAGTAVQPAANLDLSGTPSSQNAQELTSYVDLLTQQQIPGPNDANGNPTTITVGPFLDAGDSNGADSTQSLAIFAPTSGDTIHAGLLTPAELRLISEWLDIGAQYFNNPFDPAVPLN
jgi:hypothetical protein